MVEDVLIHHGPAAHRVEGRIGSVTARIIVIETKHMARFMDQGMGIDRRRAGRFVDEIVGHPEIDVCHRALFVPIGVGVVHIVPIGIGPEDVTITIDPIDHRILTNIGAGINHDDPIDRPVAIVIVLGAIVTGRALIVRDCFLDAIGRGFGATLIEVL
ncbi:MAG: hypothetical protein BWY98_01209 [Tenericutes bacterium ADurb.BinA155]|nr:MAG: hypothetical protein BWY98_01209 [Tenericutes bacterium ADurb.BinA155]